jgi:hypothetical protein
MDCPDEGFCGLSQVLQANATFGILMVVDMEIAL